MSQVESIVIDTSAAADIKQIFWHYEIKLQTETKDGYCLKGICSIKRQNVGSEGGHAVPLIISLMFLQSHQA